MKIIIDMQGAQTDFSRYRGVGRYTMGLVKALLKCSKEHEIVIVLNGYFSDAVDSIRAELEDLIPQKNIYVWEQYYDSAANNPAWVQNKKIAEISREIFLNSLKGDIVFSTNLQEGLFESAATSVHLISSNLYYCTTLHDVTPLLIPEQYLADATNRTWYYEKLKGVQKSDIIITDSLYSKEQIGKFLEIPKEKIHVLYLAVDTRLFKPMDISLSEKKSLFEKIGILDQFIIYTGGADLHKNLDRLYEAYSILPKSVRQKHQLVMVGKEIQREQELHTKKLKKLEIDIEKEVVFAGYVSDEDLALLYNCCALFVFPSTEEGFGLPPLEAMACGAPVIGSNAASIPEVIGFQDALFNPLDCSDIASKMQKVLTDYAFRDTLCKHGLQQVQKFSWKNSASHLIDIFEKFMTIHKADKVSVGIDDPIQACIDEIAKVEGFKDIASDDLARVAASLADSFASNIKRKLFLDMSSVINIKDRTGIQRVALSIAKHLISTQHEVEIIPVYTTVDDHEFYCADSIMEMFGKSEHLSENKHIEFNNGDILIFLDLHPLVAISHLKKTKHLRNRGIEVYHVVYDLLPMQFPDYFWAELCEEFAEWLKAVSQSDGVFCISKTVASEFEEWYAKTIKGRKRKFTIDWFHLGADIQNSFTSFGLPSNSDEVIHKLKKAPSFVMVGTIEPRKAHIEVLEAFESLWADGMDINLVIIGKKGWRVEPLVKKITNHSELNKRLFWLEAISDEYLELIYANSSALIAASFGEGFGLPLIEAAQHRLPVIARDISVFREVAGDNAFYFKNPDILAEEIKNWIGLYSINMHPKSEMMQYLTWQQSATQLLSKIIGYVQIPKR